MKKYSILAVVLVLTATVFTGCGRRRVPETVPHTETIMPTIMPTEAPTTVPHTEATTEHTTATTEHNNTIPDGTGNATTATNPSEGSRARTRTPNVS